MMILLLATHILGALFWVGGMAFAYTMLRPAAAPVPSPADGGPQYLDSDPNAKLQFAGIYVRARETVQRSRIRYAKAKQWGERLARLMSWISSSATKHRQRQSVAVDQNTLRKETPIQQPLIWPVLNVNI